MYREHLWNDLYLDQPEGWFRLGTDSVACAWFSRFAPGSRVLDLGCGSGALALMLLASDRTLQLTGVELDPVAAEAARHNAAQVPDQFTVLEGDLRLIQSLVLPGSMDGVIANPPYFPAGSGPAAQGAKAQARSEDTCSLAQLAFAAHWALRWGGKCTLVHHPERLADLIWELRSAHLEPKRLRFVRHRAEKPASLVLLEARKGGKSGLSLEPDLVLHSEAGPTAEYSAMYHLK